MAGYKQSILDHQPKLFLTFDGDLADENTGWLIENPERIIIDESGEGNHGTMIVDHDTIFSYRLKQPSLIELELLDSYSCTFGSRVPYPENLHPSRWAQSFIQVPHSDSFSFSRLNGSYTLGFMYRREGREDAYYREGPNAPYYFPAFRRAFIRKGLVLQIDTVERYTIGYGSPHSLIFTYLIGTDGLTRRSFDLGFEYSNDSTYYNHVRDFNNIVVTWDVVPSSSALWVGTLKIYLNGIVVHTDTQEYFDMPPTTNVSSPWEFGGAATDPGTEFADRQVTPTTLDQIFVLDKALTEDEVNVLFRKTRTYKRLVTSQKATDLWAMDDDNIANMDSIWNTVRNNTSSYLGKYYGILTNQVFRNYPGPPRIPGSFATYFRDGGSGRATNNTNGTSYTIEGWFNTSFVRRGVLFSTFGLENPWRGMTMEINMRNNLYDFGRIQLSLSESDILLSKPFKEDGVTPNYFNDGQWHYFCITRNAGMVEFWLDGIKQSEFFIGTFSTIGTHYHFMSAPPGDLFTDGLMCYFASYDYKLSAAQIRTRWTTGITWRIRGTTTLHGIPHETTVRAIRHTTGEHLGDIKSDPNDGTYMVKLFDNSLVDLIVFDRGDINVRQRTFGPITPTLHDDI